jgi:hypothetical protein
MSLLPKHILPLKSNRLDAGAHKFDEPMLASLQLYEPMFAPVAEMIRWSDTQKPASSYMQHYGKWRTETENTIDTILKDSEMGFTADEEAATDIAMEISTSIFEIFLRKSTAMGWASQSVEERQSRINEVLSLPQIPQRTPAWYAQGKSVLTASEFATLFGSERAVRQMAFQKIAPVSQMTNRLACLTHEMGPFDWGIRFEPVVKIILERLWGAKILESGRLLHPSDPLLAASPDGLILEATDPARVGRLLEIKCPVSREITEVIPFEYWCQMQIQMEVVGIDECEYVEVKLDSLSQKNHGPIVDPEGFVWLFQDPVTYEMMYAYSEEEAARNTAAGIDLVERIPWRLQKVFTKTVTRDRAWFQGTTAMRQKFWETVEQARTGLLAPIEPKKLKVVVAKEGACLITDD